MSYLQLSMKRHIARKQHRCIWCGQQIQASDPYISVAGINDDEFQANKFHPECDKACIDEAAYWGWDFEFSPHENERPKPCTTLSDTKSGAAVP